MEKHSGQQPNNSQKFRQIPGKTPIWGNPTREREIFIILQESTKHQQTHISSQGKYLTAQNLSHINLPHFSCENRTVVWPPYASFSMPTISCTDYFIWPKNNK
jgi:hypothetical protein